MTYAIVTDLSDVGDITGFLENLVIGNSYCLTNDRNIEVSIVDSVGSPISSFGTRSLASATITFTIKRNGDTDTERILTGVCAWTDPTGTGTTIATGLPYVSVDIYSSETTKGLLGYQYYGLLTFTWSGTGSAGNDVITFKTSSITFTS
jgi:hypothetical protein